MIFAFLVSTGLLTIYLVLVIRARRKRAELVQLRVDHGMGDFLKEFEDASYEEAILEMAYDDLSKAAQMHVRRKDDLEKTLGFLPEDFEDLIISRCQKLGVADCQKSPAATLFPLKTVEDYVRFLDLVSKKNSDNQ